MQNYYIFAHKTNNRQTLNVSELKEALGEIRKEYLKNRSFIVLSVANDATAIMKRRIVNEKINSSGTLFGIYKDSTIKKKGTRVAPNGDKRINFSDTNRMWYGVGPEGNNIGVSAEIIRIDDGRMIVKIHPVDDPNRQEVLKHLEKRFGPIVDWNEKEKRIIEELYQKQIERLLNNSGL